MNFASAILMLVAVSFVWALIAQKFRQPLILGYILAGITIGSFLGSDVLSANLEGIQTLSDIGIALLLFSLGLDSFLPQLKQIKKICFIGTPIQVLLTALTGLVVAYFLDWNLTQGLWWGAIIAFSNTVVVIKILESRGMMGTLSSQVMLGMLITQDILVLPVIVFLPLITGPDFSWMVLGVSLLKAASFLLVVFAFGRLLLPKILRYVADWNSREFFLVFIICLSLGIGYLTFLIGLPFSFGAFVAGALLNGSDYDHQALQEIRPLRDLFILLFFCSVGVLVQIDFILEHWLLISALALSVFALKGSIFAFVARLFGYRNIIPIALGLTLFQLGEFSFVLAKIGFDLGDIDLNFYNLALSVAIFTIAFTPILANFAEPVYQWVKQRKPKDVLESNINPRKPLKSHIVIAGGGRVGQHIGHLLKYLEIHFVIIELNHQRMMECKKAGLPYIFGDATYAMTLEAAKIESASMLLITTPSLSVSKEIMALSKKMNFNVHTIARADDVDAMKVLYGRGVQTVVMPEMEGGLEIAKQVFLKIGLPLQIIQQYGDSVRKHLYGPLYDKSPEDADHVDETMPSLEDIRNWLEVSWVQLNDQSPFIGKTIKDLNIRAETGALVVATIQKQNLVTSPDGEYTFGDKDQVAIVAKADGREKFLNFSHGKVIKLEASLL